MKDGVSILNDDNNNDENNYLLVIFQPILILVSLLTPNNRTLERFDLGLRKPNYRSSDAALLLAHPFSKFAVHRNLTTFQRVLQLLLT